ncbi:arginine--tRNA ligase [Candidatus Levibacter sp. Uisw_134_01]|uniref:arginine--tRNA ligase n=1 Tax=Candidatus Levibacter sp. Uisw_134_01 TaxID=3230999 RepID=UPI003D423858
MNIYKIYFGHLINAINSFKNDFSYTFDIEPYLTKLTLEPPKETINGDMSTNMAMVLSKEIKLNPRQIAQNFVPYITKIPGIEKVDVAGAGFINIKLAQVTWTSCLKNILLNQLDWDKFDLGKGKNINLEFVSANPTGPLHAGHARGAVFGDALASLLTKVGYKVTREYYINDAGSQIEKLVKSSLLRYEECMGKKIDQIPDGLYPGEYLKDVGKVLFDKYGKDLLLKDKAKVFEIARSISLEIILKTIKTDLQKIGIEMDVYSSEQKIVSSELLENVLKILEDKELVYSGTLPAPKGVNSENWETREQLLFRSTSYGDDTDRALKKSDGSWTYFATDMAYHLDKIKRTNGNLINVLGADHTGYISRINAAVRALSNEKSSIDTKVCALVNLLEDDKPIKMSKRAGNFVTLSEIIEAVGKDVIRFIMLTRRNDQTLDFDFKKVTEKSKENPVFYVQYAHARCNSIFKSAKVLEEDVLPENLNLLTNENEIALIKFITLWPRVLELAARNHEPHRICYYLIELASNFHSLWSKGKDDNNIKFVLESNHVLTNSRLSLVKAVALTLRKGLSLLSIEPIFEM